jgi:DNA-binding SARP family transcriptional activator
MVGFFILGPIEARSAGRRISVTAPKQQAVLAALVLEANRFLSVDRLAEYVWDGSPPTSAASTLQAYVYRLRQLLSPMREATLRTSAAGYALEVDDTDIDLTRFHRHVDDAREMVADGDPAAAVAEFRRALSLWRGPALAGVPGEALQQEAQFLEGERIAAQEDLMGAELALGNHRRVVPELLKLVAKQPFREALSAQLMVALYRSGRQAEALEAYALTRRRLREELGIEPGAELQELQKAILGHVPAARIPLPSPSR